MDDDEWEIGDNLEIGNNEKFETFKNRLNKMPG